MEDVSFGAWLRLKRKGLDLTREALAACVACSASTIQKIEEEERRPSSDLAARIADVLSISAGEYPDFLRYARGELRFAKSDSEEDPPWRPYAGRTRSNIPAPLTRLIGRAREMEDIRLYLCDENVRLVTVTGPPGVGKTRLSIEVAQKEAFRFTDGVIFVSLATLDNPAVLALTIAQSLGFVQSRETDTEMLIQEGISDKEFLLVLDNCEHVTDVLAKLVATLLSNCHRLHILATSRELFHIAGEWSYPLASLPVPRLTDTPETNDLSQLESQFPLLSLFAERARAVKPDFELTASNVRAVTELCRRLDGLPLAVELVAARNRSMTPQALLDRLDDSFVVLTDGARGVSERQRSLKQAIDWSYRLLSTEEQTLFSFLSVFAGEFTLSAAQAVCAPLFEAAGVTEALLSLVDKSLVQRALDREAEPRYVMLATIRAFARDRLSETGNEAVAQDRQLAWILDVAIQADLELRGSGQQFSLNQLESLRDNIHVALDWAIASARVESALLLVNSLWWFWSMRSEFTLARQWTARVAEMPGASAFPDLHAEVLAQRAHHTLLQSGALDGRLDVGQALEIARSRALPRTLASVLMVFGLVSTMDVKIADARAAFDESLSLCRDLDDKWGQALVRMSKGYLASKTNDAAKALTLCESAMHLFRSLGEQYFQSVCLYEIGSLRAELGDHDDGLAALRASLEIARDLGSNYEIATGLMRLGHVERQVGRWDRTVRLHCAARTAYDMVGAWSSDDGASLEETLTLSREVLSVETFTAAREEGKLSRSRKRSHMRLTYKR
ncbi:MAG: NB-ARC domain-containing protein [Nitrolancea sp.]